LEEKAYQWVLLNPIAAPVWTLRGRQTCLLFLRHFCQMWPGAGETFISNSMS
jgi:hypothetical protein